MPPISVGTSTTSSSQATCFQIPLQMLEQYMSHGQFQEVQDLLFARFRYAQSEQEVEECYQLLFKLLPHCTPLGVLENNLTNLLDKSASLAKEQEQLALLLGQRYLQEKELKKAMLCFAKALQMNRSQDNYSAASQVFLQYFEMQKEEHLKLFLENAIPSLDTMDFHVKRIEALKAFGISKEILMPFFLKITNRVNNIHCDDQAKYRPCEKTSQEMLNSSWELDQTAVERYWDALQKFRACFACQDASKIQEKTFKAMKELIALCIEDISILIGPPPCHYDFRAMGSLARKEMCPYSDLECMLLIEDNQYRPYFNRMLHLLELQMASFGETQGLGLVFTCISHPSGLHLDKPPLEETRLMQTPEQMALLQKSEAYDVVCINVLKAISLYQTTPQLDTDYKEHVQSIRNEFSFPFFDVCKQRIHDFSFAWRKHFDWTHFTDFTYDIKEKFVETLYHPLSDLAVYLRIESTNTLEIADVLIDRKVLPENMRDLLKESILLIYQIRVRNHQKYRTQEEKVNLTPSEIETLEKCYWQILIPLHTCFKKLTDSKEPHRQYFENLCKIDDSEVLLKQLKGSASILDAVLRLPDSSTTRPIYTIKMDALQGSITAITSPSSPSAPGEISVQIKSPHFRESRFLPYDLIKKIMEGFNLKQQYTNSAHRVCRLQYGMRDLHLKQTPSNPLMEYAIYSLVSRIAGEYTPPSTLVRFDVEQQGQKKSYPVLICQTISGENLKTAWSKATANRSYTWNLLAAILTKPQDGRFSNYVLHEQDLVCVDNDLAFVEPVTSSLFGMSRAVHFSAAPFCLFPLDTPLDKGVLGEFAVLDAVGICKAWVKEVIEKEKEYVNLFTEEERKSLLDKDSCTLNILLKEGTFSTLNLQFWQLQNTIQTALSQNKILTAGDLLQQLVSLTDQQVGGYVYRAYNNARATPEERLGYALGRKQDVSVTPAEHFNISLGQIPKFDEIEKLKKYSLQEASQELFHAFSIESEHAFCANKQGKSALGVNFKGLSSSVRESKILVSMNEIMKDAPQKIVSLSFHFSKQIDTNRISSFLHPNLEKIDLRHCDNIDNTTVWLIEKECPNLKELILIGCPKITEIGNAYFSWLTFSHLETLVIGHTSCSKLLFKAPKLRFLNVSHNPELVYLEFEAPLLSEIKAKNPKKINLSTLAKRHAIQALARTPKNLTTAPILLLNIWQNGELLRYASEELKNDKEFVLAAVSENRRAFQYASEELKRDKEFVLTAVEEDRQAFQYASEELKSDREFMVALVKTYGHVLFKYACEELKSDREVVLAAVQKRGLALEYASEELKSDREIVLAAVQQNGWAFTYASEELKSDREVVLVAVQQDGWALEYASEELKRDREFVLTAVQKSGTALRYASVELKSDREIVLAAVQKRGWTLEYVSEELKNDREIVVAAVQKSGWALEYASEELKNDREIVVAAVQKSGWFLKYASEEFKSDREIVLAAVQQDGWALEYASETLKNDREIVVAAVQQAGWALEYASETLKNDREIVVAAVRQNGLALQYASEELKSNREIVLAAVKQNEWALEYASEELKTDREIALATLMKNRWAFQYAAEELKTDKIMMLAAGYRII